MQRSKNGFAVQSISQSGLETLKKALDCGMLDLTTMCEQVRKMERQTIIKAHDKKIWCGKDGKYRTYFDDGTGRKLIVRKRLEDLEDFLCENIPHAQNPTFRQVFEMWTSQKMDYGEIQKSTLDRYVAVFEQRIKGTWLENARLETILPENLEGFIREIIPKEELTAKAWGNLRIILFGTLVYGKKHGFTDMNVGEFFADLQLSNRIFKRKIVRDETQVFSPEEVQKIFDYEKLIPPTLLDLGVMLAFHTGLRVGEISALRVEDIYPNMIRVERTEIKYIGENGERVTEVRPGTKGTAGCRNVVLTREADAIARQCISMNPSGTYLFEENGKRIPAKAFSHRIRKICKEVGIAPRSFHKIRKTYGTKLLSSGVEDKIIQSQMGHTDILTTKRFYYYNSHQVSTIQTILESATYES